MKKKVTGKNTSKNTSDRKSSHKESSHRKVSHKNRTLKDSRLHDIMDLDEDWNEDWVHPEEEADEDDWEEEFGVPVNKKLLSGMAAACVLLLLAAAVLFAFYSRKADTALEAAALSVNPSWAALAFSQLSTDIQAGISTGTLSDAGNSAGTSDDAGISTGTSGDAEISAGSPNNTEVSVGALDDAEDPQNSGAAGNEGTGAEVTVSKTNKDETTTVTLGIDVSKYQGTINWAEVKASGVDFAMIRVGYRAKSTGEIFEDPAARYNMQEAQAAGVKIGAYFFSSAITKEEAREEAAFTANIIARYKITYPVAFNCEDFQSPDSRQYGLDAAQRTELACAFLDEISAAGYTPMFYASKGELEGSVQWNTDTLASRYKMWVAQYPEKPYPETASSSYSGSHDMWQYTSQGTVAGISKKTDVNVAYFGYLQEAEAKDETPAETVSANPEIGIIFTEVNETVTAKQETNLRTEPSTLNDDSIVGKLVHGDTATRTGIGHNGWSRVIYNGQTLYAVTSYLTTDMADTGQQAPPQGPVYTPVNEQVTAKMETNLRTEPSTASDNTIVALLHNGETLTRTAIGDNGWSQLDYNGQTVYAVSSYLIVQ